MLDKLMQYEQWIVWKSVEGRKVPFDPKTGDAASTTSKKTWGSYQDAKHALDKSGEFNGIGFVFTRDDPFFGIDLDKCVTEEGETKDHALRILDRCKHTYAEYSPSGTGFHVIGEGKVPGWSHKKDDKRGIEVYDNARYFTMTFDHVDEHGGDVENAQEALTLVCDEFLRKQRRGGHQPHGELQGQGELPVLTEGQRDEELFAIARSLYHKGCAKWQAYSVVEQVAANARPPFDADQARQKVDSAWKTEDPHPMEVVRMLNKRYALLENGEVLRESDDPDLAPTTLSPQAVRTNFKPYQVRYEDSAGRVQRINYFDFWLSHPERRWYKRMEFKPNGDVERDVYNLWGGFAVKPKKGSCQYFLQHVRENLCKHHDPEYAEFILDWLAGIARDPGKGPSTALVLLGGQGTGKSCFGDYVGKMIGQRHFLKTSNHQHFLGKFNYDMALSVFMHVDEAIWGGDKKQVGQLKSLITDRKQTVEPKNKERMTIDNNVHLLITSNEQWAVSIDPDDRRFVVMDIGKREERASAEFFEKFFDEMHGDGPSALLYYLLHERNIESTNPKPPRNTEIKREVQEMSLDSVGQVLSNWLTEERIGARREWVQVIWFNELYSAYKHEARELGARVLTATNFSKALKRYLAVERERGRRLNAIRQRYGVAPDESGEELGDGSPRIAFVLPAMEDAREQFEQACSGN